MQTRWVTLAAIVLARVGIGVQFISVAAVIPELQAELGFDFARIGVLLGVYMLAGVFLSLPSGMIAARLGNRRMLQIGLLALVAAGVLFGVSDSFATLLAARMIGGIGAVFITVTAATLLADAFAGKEINTAMSLMGVAWPVGIALGVSLLPQISVWLDWRDAVFMTAAVPLLPLILVTILPLGSPRRDPAAATRTPLWSIRPREFWILVVGSAAWPLMSSGGYLVFSSYAPSLLAERGIAATEAGLTVSLLSWLIIITIPLGGWLADRLGLSDSLFWVGCLVAAAAIAMVPFAGPVELWIVLSAVLGVTVGPIMALPGQVLRPESRNTGFGIYFTLYYLGTGTLPALAGWLLNTTGSLPLVIWLSALCLALAPLSLLAMRLMQNRWSMDTGPHQASPLRA